MPAAAERCSNGSLRQSVSAKPFGGLAGALKGPFYRHGKNEHSDKESGDHRR